MKNIQFIAVSLLLLTGCANHLEAANQKINKHPYSKEYDCRSYAVDKYRELKKAGYKDSEMLFVITSYQGAPHMVLNVDGQILDNTSKYIYPATKQLSSGLQPEFWLKVNSLL